MPLTISAPHLERRLEQAAQEQHTTPAALAVQLLETLLPGEVKATSAAVSPGAVSPTPVFPAAERKALFHRWLEHNQASGLPSLPAQALERVSFYDDERHLHPSSS